MFKRIPEALYQIQLLFLMSSQNPKSFNSIQFHEESLTSLLGFSQLPIRQRSDKSGQPGNDV